MHIQTTPTQYPSESWNTRSLNQPPALTHHCNARVEWHWDCWYIIEHNEKLHLQNMVACDVIVSPQTTLRVTKYIVYVCVCVCKSVYVGSSIRVNLVGACVEQFHSCEDRQTVKLLVPVRPTELHSLCCTILYFVQNK